MLARSSPRSEPDDVRVELISALYLVLWPTIIITLVFLAVAAFAYAEADAPARPWVATIAVAGIAAAIFKLLMTLSFRYRSPASLTIGRAIWWERWHAYGGWVFSVAVGCLTALTFSSPSPMPQLLATALLFGHSSGIVVRGLARPRICTISLFLVVIPVITAAAMHRDLGHYLLAVTCILFLLGGLESVWSGYNSLIRQIEERNDLASIARHDALTGLSNRLGLREGFDRLLRATGDDIGFAVHCLDLNRFKPVNDRYGHPAGDELLRQIADRIRDTIRPGDVAARTGGDEFVVVQHRVRVHKDAEVFADALSLAISAPYTAKGHVIVVGVSIGSAVSGSANISLGGLISEADNALMIAKREAGYVVDFAQRR